MSDQSQAIDNKPSIDLIQKVSFMTLDMCKQLQKINYNRDENTIF